MEFFASPDKRGSHPAICRAQIRTALRIIDTIGLAFVVQNLMPGKQRRAERAARIARGRLDPDVIENAFAQNAPVRDAIERDAAGQTKISLSGFLANVPRHSEHDFLGHILDRAREVHVALGQFRFRLTRRAVKQSVERDVGHGQADAIIEIFHVEPERAVLFEIDQLAQN